jgi:hypothetical protein
MKHRHATERQKRLEEKRKAKRQRKEERRQLKQINSMILSAREKQ